MKTPLELDDRGYVNSICLPGPDDKVAVGEVAIGAGWGAMRKTKDAFSIQTTLRLLFEKNMNKNITVLVSIAMIC